MDDEKLDLRDKFAIEIFNGLLSHSKEGTGSLASDIYYYINYTNDNDLVYQNKHRSDATGKVEKAVRACYKVADIFRKVRLSSFE
jgi:hypothetical protein